MTDENRYFQFYIEDVGTTTSRRVRDGLEVHLQFGGLLGTFPRSDGERFSWYLCDCEAEPVARRIRKPDDLICPLCSRKPRRVLLCSCGVASPIAAGGEGASCSSCARAVRSEAHDCRAIDGMEVVVDQACPFCDWTAPAPLASEPDARRSPIPLSPGSWGLSVDLEEGEPKAHEEVLSGEVEDACKEPLHRDSPDSDLTTGRVHGGALGRVTSRTSDRGEGDKKSGGRSRFGNKLIGAVTVVVLLGGVLFVVSSSDGPSPPSERRKGDAPMGIPGGTERDGRASQDSSLAYTAPQPASDTERDSRDVADRAASGPGGGTWRPQEPSPEESVADSATEPRDHSVPPVGAHEVAGQEGSIGFEPGTGGAPRGVRLARATNALERGDWEAAVDGAQSVLALDPEDPVAQALLERAVAELKEIEQEERLESWRTALKVSNSPNLKEYYARRILSEDPDDPLAVAVRLRVRNEAVERSKQEAEDGNVEAVTAIWEEYTRAWPDDELARAERERWALEATTAAEVEDVPAPPEPLERKPSDPSPTKVQSLTLEQLHPVRIPVPWSFEMGCTRGDPECSSLEKPRHDVELVRPFRITAYETTNDAYRNCVETGSCSLPAATRERVSLHEPVPYQDPNKGFHPVVRVSWVQADEFCRWLGGRLPTEAEWEAAARGLILGSRYPWVGELSHDKANFSGTNGRDRWEGTSPVGSFEKNRYGLYDMAGNVREWVKDWRGNYHKTQRPARDPEGPSSGQGKIIRGGSWSQPPEKLRVSYREWAGATGANDDLGFRCVIPES